MKFIEEIKIDKSKKKVVGARVPVMILNALDMATPVLKERYGFKFSIPKIIEKALSDTLKEIKVETGLDFYELEKFKHEMNQLKDRLNESAPGLNLVFEESIADYIIMCAHRRDDKYEFDMIAAINENKKSISEDMNWQYDNFKKVNNKQNK
jgi:hypothetical protein